MNTTIAVAVITVLATISAGSIAGIISIMTQNRQAGMQREERRWLTPRDAYVDLLAKSDGILNALTISGRGRRLQMNPTR